MVTARELADLFYTAENGNICILSEPSYINGIAQEDEDTFLAKVETAQNMVFGAESAGLGFDGAYEAVRDCLYHLADTEEDPTDSDTAHSAADSLVDVYTTDLVSWLASAPLKHLPLCDEAAEEMGEGENGLERLIRLGQYHAYTLTMQAIADNWPDDDDDSDDDGADDIPVLGFDPDED